MKRALRAIAPLYGLAVWEARMWRMALVAAVPGRLGCALRNAVLPYHNGSGVTVWDGVRIEWPQRLIIGNCVSINRGTLIQAGGGVTIEDDVLIGPGVTIYSQNHRYQGSGPIRQQGYTFKAVCIRRGAWVAANATVLPGVTIGEKAIVAAGTVVTKDVPAGALATGVPAAIRPADRARPAPGSDPGPRTAATAPVRTTGRGHPVEPT